MLTGTVTTPANQPLSGVRLLLGQRTATTGADGTFSFDDLQEGGYTLALQAPNGDYDCRSIVVAEGQTTQSLTLPSPLGGLRVARVEPLLNSTGLSLGGTFELFCTASLDASSVSIDDFQVTPAVGDIAVTVVGSSIVLQPRLQLAPATSMVVEVNGDIRSTTGQSLSKPVRWAFRTAGTDTAAPRLVAVTPASGAVDIGLNQPIRLEFNERLENPTGIGVVSNPAMDVLASLDSTGRTLVLQPTSNWTPATQYTVIVTGVTDVAGNVQPAPIQLTFSVGTQSVLTHNQQADWNRSTNRIVFSSDRAGSGYDVWSIDPVGDELHPSLSADGSRLAFQRLAENGRWDIYVAGIVEGVVSVPQALTPLEFNDYEPQFSRTLSNTIVFTSDRGARVGLYSMNEDGGLPTELDPTFGPASTQPAANPLLDGQYLFSAVTGDRRNIWRKSVSVVDGTTVNTDLTQGRLSDDYSPAWGSDTSFIVFASDFSGTPNLWLAEANGDFARQVTSFADSIDDPFPSPLAGDSTCVMTYHRADGGSDLVMVSLVSGAILRNLTSVDGPQP
jgi:hypothetical protein